MRILYIVSRELDYPRNDVLLRAFQRISDVEVLGSQQKPASLFLRSLSFSTQSCFKLAFHPYDLVFVGFYGHLMMLPIRVFSRCPVLFDAYVSTYDTLTSDRNLFSPHSLGGRLAFHLDRKSCSSADHILLDTPLHVDYFVNTFGLQRDKITALPVGCNEDLFHPRPGMSSGNVTKVLYYSSYLPLHGVDIVVHAAAILKSAPIRFRLVGDGPLYPQVRKLSEKLGLDNIEFLPFLPMSSLPDEIAAADICLAGHFGCTDKAQRVVPSKVYQILAMGKPLIASSTPANSNLLHHGDTAYLCLPGDPASLAEAILELHTHPQLRMHLSQCGYQLYKETCSEMVITQRLKEIVDSMRELYSSSA